jgi:cellulose biosynthesis protein BcsQ
MNIITVWSRKGGALKTSLATSLAVLAAEEGPTALLDADVGQHSCVVWAKGRQRGPCGSFRCNMKQTCTRR